jgi:hypothetical protein
MHVASFDYPFLEDRPMLARILPRNEGTTDRVLRVLFGLVLLALVFVGPRTPWGYLGLLPLVTGLVGSCPTYRLFGISTTGMHRA